MRQCTGRLTCGSFCSRLRLCRVGRAVATPVPRGTEGADEGEEQTRDAWALRGDGGKRPSREWYAWQ